MPSSPITSWQIEWEKVEAVTAFLFLGSKITVDGDCSHGIRRWLLLGRKAMTNLVHWKAETLLFYIGLYSQGYDLPSGHIQLWELYRKAGRAPKDWCLRTAVLEKTPESPLDSKEIKPVSLKGNSALNTRWMDWCWSSTILVIWFEQLTHW